MNWSEQQTKALKEVEAWFKSKPRKQVFRVFGFAGTGKTTIAKHFAQSIKGDTLYAAYTGKAALVLRKNGCTGASTIHSLIYKVKEDDETGEVHFEMNKKSALRDAALLVVDECSMVDEEMGRDILSFGKPVLVLGDPAQLPPVSGAGFFTNAEPDVMLTEIHRQAKDNPIVHLATLVRNGQKLRLGDYGNSRVVDTLKVRDLVDHSQVIVGRNATRDNINSKIRKVLKFEDELPTTDDRLICLKNDRDLGIFNGGLFTVKKRIENKRSPYYNLYQIVDNDTGENRVLTVKVHNSFFDGSSRPDWKLLKGTQEFDFGYAITCHKSQGSQWDNVLIFDESWCFREESKRWLYTALTRASESVTVYSS